MLVPASDEDVPARASWRAVGTAAVTAVVEHPRAARHFVDEPLPERELGAWQRHLVGAATVLFGVGETAIMGVHGLLLLAVPAVLLARTAMPASRQLRVVALAVAAVGVAMVILAEHAFRQLPWNQLPLLAVAALALCTAALLARTASSPRR